MKLYIRLLWANHVTKLVLILLSLGLLLTLCPKALSDKVTLEVVHNDPWLIAFACYYWGILIFAMTKFGMSPVERYNELIDDHKTGHKHVATRGNTGWPCYRAAYRVAIKDLNIKPEEVLKLTTANA